MLTWEEKSARANLRIENRNPLIQRMRDVARHYDGDWVIPIPGTEASLQSPLGPALIAEAIDNAALRAASVMPSVQCVPLDPDKHQGVRSQEYASIRKAAVLDGYRRANLPLVLGKAHRQYTAYAGWALAVDHDYDTHQPCLRLLDPLGVYPEPRSDTDFTPHDNVAIVYERSGRDLVDQFPTAHRYIQSNDQLEGIYQVLEWHDGDGVELGVLSGRYRTERFVHGLGYTREIVGANFRLAFVPSRIGRCDIVVAGAVSLTTAVSRLSKLTGGIEMMARLTALVMRATERSVFPDLYMVGKDGEMPKIAGGTWKEGTTGQINILQNVDNIGQLRNTPDPVGMQMMDRLERDFRVSSGQPSILSGEPGSNALRTGRGMDTFMATSTDPRIAEMQRVAAVALTHAGELMLDTYRAYAPNRKFTVYASGRSKRTRREFTPATHVENTEVQVWYPFEGNDADAVTIRLGQLVGTQMMSRTTAREVHPMIDDATDEAEAIQAEAIEEAILQTVLARAQDPAGGIPPQDLARIAQLVRDGVNIADAVLQAQEEAQARQAKIAPPAPEGMAAPPETMPGLGMPGEGQQMIAPPPPEQGVVEPLQRFKSLVQAGRVPYGGQTGPLG